MTDIVRGTNSYIYNVWRTYIIVPVVHIMAYIVFVAVYVSYIDGVSSIVNPTSRIHWKPCYMYRVSVKIVLIIYLTFK